MEAEPRAAADPPILAPESDPEWFVADDGMPIGPLRLEDVLERIRACEIGSASLVRRRGANWAAANTIPELLPALEAAGLAGMNAEWYARVNGKAHGPMTLNRLRGMIEGLAEVDMVKRGTSPGAGHSSEWTGVHRVPELSGASMDRHVMRQRVERDILLLYHQMAPYEGFMGDLYYGDVFALPYWEFIVDREWPDDDELLFEGCLIMILAMADEVMMGAGGYIFRHLSECVAAVERLAPGKMSEDRRKLVRTVRLALAEIQSGGRGTPEIEELMRWAYRRYVARYFLEVARHQPTLPG